MSEFLKYRSFIITLFLISGCIIVFTTCINNEKDKAVAVTTNGYTDYAGSASCTSCHQAIAASHRNTAHFHTSETANEKNIRGSFDATHSSYTFSNNGGMINMEKRGDDFYQVGYINGIEKKAERFDITIGSASKGQSYASWMDNKLVQLPITYFTSADAWSNSPGYPNKVAFNRPITSRCLECHATYVQKISAPEKEPEEFDRSAMILGVDCERCHGPAAKHVAFQKENLTDTAGKFIINPSSFSRQQSLDLCALCHGGRLQKTTASFGFTAGDKLTDHFLIDTVGRDINSIDVHGNQYGLMAASKCFTVSHTLTCNSCHNVHENEKGKATLFAQRCNTCHTAHNNTAVCKMAGALSNEQLNTNCINCHMPEQPSMAIAVILQGQNAPSPALMHTHFIKSYPGETKKILALLKTITN
jgi:hypothetical protein